MKLTDEQRQFFNEMITATADTTPILNKYKARLKKEETAKVLACVAMDCYIKTLGLNVENDEMPEDVFDEFYYKFMEEC